MTFRLTSLCSLLIAAITLACGGGGGGGGSGRTTDTAVRVVHGALRVSPVTLFIDSALEDAAQTGRYGEPTQYSPVAEGDRTLILQRANSPDVFLGTLASTLEEGTEYSIFLLDAETEGRLRLSLVTDTVTRPDTGRALFRAMNAYHSEPITAITSEGELTAVPYAGVSNFIDVPFGPQTIRIVNSDGVELGSRVVDFPDRGEVTMLASGDEELGVFFVTLYTDLD